MSLSPKYIAVTESPPPWKNANGEPVLIQALREHLACHELGNIWQGVSGYLELVRETTHAPDLRDDLSALLKEVCDFSDFLFLIAKRPDAAVAEFADDLRTTSEKLGLTKELAHTDTAAHFREADTLLRSYLSLEKEARLVKAQNGERAFLIEETARLIAAMIGLASDENIPAEALKNLLKNIYLYSISFSDFVARSLPVIDHILAGVELLREHSKLTADEKESVDDCLSCLQNAQTTLETYARFEEGDGHIITGDHKGFWAWVFVAKDPVAQIHRFRRVMERQVTRALKDPTRGCYLSEPLADILGDVVEAERVQGISLHSQKFSDWMSHLQQKDLNDIVAWMLKLNDSPYTPQRVKPALSTAALSER